MTTLFLLTKNYPFGSGEPYIHNELPYLAQAFDKVIIYPNDQYDKNTQHNRTLPANVEILNFNQVLYNNKTSRSAADVAYLLKNTLLEFFATDDKTYFFKNFKWNLLNFWTQYQLAKAFAQYLSQNKVQLGHCVFYSYWLHKSAMLLSVLKDKKEISGYVSRAHSIDLYHNRWGIINKDVVVPPFKMFKLRHADKVLSISKHGETFLKKHFPKYSAKFDTFYLGVNEMPLQQKQPADDHFHMVTCSGVDANKRLHRLAEALQQVTAPLRWTHFGDGILMPQLKEQIKSLPKNIDVQLKGSVPNQQVKDFYASQPIDLFVNLSVVEGLPVSIMEAMWAGIPILATNVYGTPEAVIENKNGFLIGVDFSTEELAAKINYGINNRAALTAMGQASRQIAAEKFSAPKNYTQFAQYLKAR